MLLLTKLCCGKSASNMAGWRPVWWQSTPAASAVNVLLPGTFNGLSPIKVLLNCCFIGCVWCVYPVVCWCCNRLWYHDHPFTFMMKKFDLLKVGIVSNKVMAFFIYLTYALMSRVARPYQMHWCTRFCHKLSVHMLPVFTNEHCRTCDQRYGLSDEKGCS